MSQCSDTKSPRLHCDGKIIYDCLILNDYPGEHYATWIELGLKTIETRMKSFKHRGDLIICCGNNSVTGNKGKALCIVDLYDVRDMTDTAEDREAARCGWTPGRKAHLLRNKRLFSRKFSFSKRRISGAFQSIFQITLPDDVTIINA